MGCCHVLSSYHICLLLTTSLTFLLSFHCTLLPAFPSSVFLQVGLAYEVAKDLSRKSDTSPVHDELKHLTKGMPTPMKQMATSSAYVLPSLAPLISTHSPTRQQPQRSSESQDPVTPASGGEGGGGRGGGKKKESGKSSARLGRKSRSNSTSNLNQILITAAGGGSVTNTRPSTRSISPNKMMMTHGVEATGSFVSPPSRGRGRNLEVPTEVLILAVSKSSGRSSRGRVGGGGGDEWDFAVLSQDEVTTYTPGYSHLSVYCCCGKLNSPPTCTLHHCATGDSK